MSNKKEPQTIDLEELLKTLQQQKTPCELNIKFTDKKTTKRAPEA